MTQTIDQGAAWRDGDQLVVSRHAPLPSLCVLCGSPAVHSLDTHVLWEPKNRALSWMKFLDTRFPLCDVHASARRRWRLTSAALAVLFYALALTALLLVFAASFTPLVLLVPLLGLLALTVHGDRGTRHSLRVVRLDGEHAWLAGAGEGLLQQLPVFADQRVGASAAT